MTVYTRPHGETRRARHGPTNAVRLALEDAGEAGLFEPQLLAAARTYRPLLDAEQFHRVLAKGKGHWLEELDLGRWRLRLRPAELWIELTTLVGTKEA